MALSLLNDRERQIELAGATWPAGDRRSRDKKRIGEVRMTISITPKQ
jgi:hypothetical protein